MRIFPEFHDGWCYRMHIIWEGVHLRLPFVTWGVSKNRFLFHINPLPNNTPPPNNTPLPNRLLFSEGGGVGVVPKKLAGWDHRPHFTEENSVLFGGWVKRLAGPPSPRGVGAGP